MSIASLFLWHGSAFPRSVYEHLYGRHHQQQLCTALPLPLPIFIARFKESFLWAAAKGGRLEECESLVQIGAGEAWDL